MSCMRIVMQGGRVKCQRQGQALLGQKGPLQPIGFNFHAKKFQVSDSQQVRQMQAQHLIQATSEDKCHMWSYSKCHGMDAPAPLRTCVKPSRVACGRSRSRAS